MKDKIGGVKYLSIWWFFVLTIIALGVVISVSVYNSASIDVREIEADILASRVVDCLVKDGYLSREFLEEKQDFEIFKECKLNKEIIDKNEKYYFGVEAYELDKCRHDSFRVGFSEDRRGELECENPIAFYYSENKNFETLCGIKEAAEESEHYPICMRKLMYALGKDLRGEDKKLLFAVTAGSNQQVKKEVLQNVA